MLESEASGKVCPIISGGGHVEMCHGSDCALWLPDYVGPILIKATERQHYDDTGWSTNGQISEDGKVTFYRPPSGTCAAGRAA
jgi:hypothetical protein